MLVDLSIAFVGCYPIATANNHEMAEIHEIRRKFLFEFLKKFDTDVKAAEALGIKPGHLSQYKMDPDKKTSRNIGDKIARKWEKNAGLPKFWFDGVDLVAITEEHQSVLRRFDRLSAKDKQKVKGWMALQSMTDPASDQDRLKSMRLISLISPTRLTPN